MKAQMEASRLHCVSIANEFEKAQTNAEKTNIANHYNEALKRTHATQLLMELLERQEREGRGGD